VARPYAALERVVFGKALERCRTFLLPLLSPPTRALLVGEGDGRFLERLLEWFPDAQVDVVEPSAAMIRRARLRVGLEGKVQFRCKEILAAELHGPYDLVVTNFVLDVFTVEEIERLVDKLRSVAPHGKWLISEFHVCRDPAAARFASIALISTMYAFFNITTGLMVRSIPPYERVLKEHGFTRLLQHQAWSGLFSSELWSA
jgi:SAM-dependent methyltransferase